MSIGKSLTKTTSTLVRAANAGTINSVDTLAGKIETVELSALKKLGEVSRDNKHKVNSLLKINKELVKCKTDRDKIKTQIDNMVKVHDGLLTQTDEWLIKLTLENPDIKSCFTSTTVYVVSKKLTSEYMSPEKRYYNIASNVNNYNVLKLEYQKIIQRLKKIENDIISKSKQLEQHTNKINKLYDDLDRLKR